VVSVDVDGRAAWKGLPRSEILSFAKDRRGRWVEKPWVGPAQGPPDHAEANFLGGTLAQRDAHVYVYGTGGEEAANQASEKAARAAADWGPNVRARFQVLADSEVTPEIMDGRSLVLFGTASVNRLVERLAPSLPLRQDATGTFAGARRLGEADAPFRLHHPNPLASSRYVLIYGAASAEGFARLLPPRQPFLSLPHSDYLVLGPDGKPVLEGYFKDDWTIGAR
jgi:hypothetical protein